MQENRSSASRSGGAINTNALPQTTINRNLSLALSSLGPWGDELIANIGGSTARISFTDSLQPSLLALSETPVTIPNMREEINAIESFDTEANAPYPFDRSYPWNEDRNFLYRNTRRNQGYEGARAQAEAELQQESSLAQIGESVSRIADFIDSPGRTLYSSLFGETDLATVGKYVLFAVIGLILLYLGLLLIAGSGVRSAVVASTKELIGTTS